MLEQLSNESGDTQNTSWQLVHYYLEDHQPDRALPYLLRLFSEASDLEKRATCLCVFGQIMQAKQNFHAAIEFYRRAIALQPSELSTRYECHRHLALAFHAVGRLKESESHCRAAIQLEPERTDAYTIMTLTLEGQGRIEEAAALLMRFTAADRPDGNACERLKELQQNHPDLLKKAQFTPRPPTA